ncbi:MAG TPA: zinc-ribbon domain-containing protein, partial [Polyangiales bacterium]
MLKVNCEACGAPYDVDPRRIPASGLKMRCPACGATFHVQAGGAPARDASKGALDVDLPAPKAGPRAISPGTGAARSAAASPGGKLDFTDLPAAKGRVMESLPENLADDLTDPSGPGVILRAGADFELDLPAPKKPAAAGENAARPKPALAPDFAPSMPDLELDLPAPKGAVRPAPSAGEIDLPAPKQGGFVPNKPGVKPAAPSGAKPAAPTPSAGAFGGAPGPAPTPALDSFDLDLPAPKATSGAKPPAGAAKAPMAAKPQAPEPSKRSPLTPDFDLDLPAAKPVAPKGAAPKPAGIAQPAAAVPAPKPALTPDFDL